jgi:IS4 transposase
MLIYLCIPNVSRKEIKRKKKLRTPQDKDAYVIAHTKNYKIEKMGNQLINSKEKHWRIKFEMAT